MKKIIFICSVLFCSLSAFAQNSGGPDAYGYTWKSSVDPANGVTYKWIDLPQRLGHGAIDITDKFGDLDKTYGPINYSFSFPYYWYTRSYFYINSGGMICFNGGPYAEPYPAIPGKGGKIDDYIAAFWTNLAFLDIDGNKFNPEAKCYFYTDFKDTAIVSWHNVKFFNGLDAPVGSPPNISSNTFQIIITRDGNILLQYQSLTGQQQSCQSGGVCISVGCENVNGTSGLQVYKASAGATDIGDHIPEIDTHLPVAIKISPPETPKALKTTDIGIRWNRDETNGGFFIPKGKTPKPIAVELSNNSQTGNAAFKLTTKVTEEGKATATKTGTTDISAMTAAERRVVYPSTTVPVTKEAHYTIKNSTAVTGDAVKDNNSLNIFVGVVDTTQSDIILDYTDGGYEQYYKWNGADNSALGYASYYEPPFYPVKIKQVITSLTNYVGETPGAPIFIRIFANDGLNLFGQRDGSAGTMIYEDSVSIIDLSQGENDIDLKSDIQINSGGVYAGVFFTQNTTQGADTYIGMDTTTSCLSYRSFFVRNGVFQESTNQRVMDPAIAINITKGDVTKVSELSMEELVQPKITDSITTDSVQVVVRLKNNGQQAIVGPLDISYHSNNQIEYFETIPSSVTINAGSDYTYTFKKKCSKPPLPAHNYSFFCVKHYLPNDFNLSNNEICYGNVVGIKAENQIQNMNLYPNPTNGHIHIIYGLTTSTSDVKLELYDLSGRMVYSENFGTKSAGMYQAEVDLSELTNGVYACRLVSNQGIGTQKLSLLK